MNPIIKSGTQEFANLAKLGQRFSKLRGFTCNRRSRRREVPAESVEGRDRLRFGWGCCCGVVCSCCIERKVFENDSHWRISFSYLDLSLSRVCFLRSLRNFSAASWSGSEGGGGGASTRRRLRLKTKPSSLQSSNWSSSISKIGESAGFRLFQVRFSVFQFSAATILYFFMKLWLTVNYYWLFE